ncbi:hypothetical protein [Delftia tsuruhatensis]|uniref:hypothetical protein n=1 Tax=Delftia tsuruhatensis TaxID=180282 RepID=UPI0020916111|nr:hypothetical protein [Delftia tsuruhatensis]MCO5338573.1 hypothetical protein [Delftia tsuruhatensis]MCR4546643.1 hypothetical protein [Delftia tsuruhatensis]
MSEASKPARWTYAVYGPKTFGLGEVGSGAFFHIRCVYGDTKLEENIQAMEFIREASRVHHETGLTPRQLVEQRDALALALASLDEAYCRAGTPLSRDERTEDRKRLIAARAALALVKGTTP